MPQRTDQRRGVDQTAESNSGVRSQAATVFSMQFFLLSVLALAVGVLAGRAIIPVLGGLAGIFATAFILGATTDTPRRLELGAAGAIAVGLAVFFDYLVLSLVGLGVPLVAAGALLGFIVGGAGGHFGRDLRDGMTREL